MRYTNKPESAMTYEEKHLYGYMEGYRQGRIGVTREILIRVLRIEGKEHGTVPSKQLIRKINREIDIGFLSKLMKKLEPIENEPSEEDTFSGAAHLTTTVGPGAVICMSADVIPIDKKNWYVPARII